MIKIKKDAIKYKNSEGQMQSAGVLCKVGTFGEDWLKYATSWGSVFYQLKSEVPMDFVLEYGDAFKGSIANMFAYSSGVRSVKIIGTNIVTADAAGFVRNSSSLERIDVSECNFVYHNIQSTFLGCSKLRDILGYLDFSKTKLFVSPFAGCLALEEIRFVEGCLKLSISFSGSPLLSDSSIQSIINGLATVETAQTLTLHADVKAKLTEEQIATITSKNWTLA